MTDGQQLALRQLRSIEAAGPGGLEILAVSTPADESASVLVEISVDCSGVAHRPEGVALRTRERLALSIPPRFPLTKPEVEVPHHRWRGTPHVQWASHICLYAAPASEWHPADGMFGLLDRLWEWLQAASIGQLDPDGVPLHPPVAYGSRGTPLIIPRADAPLLEDRPWMGWAHAEPVGERRLDLRGWTPMRVDGERQDAPEHAAPAVLLPTSLDWEYPAHAVVLIMALIDRGVDWSDFWDLLGLAALNRPGQPLVLVIGTAMRGTDSERRQHLSAWRVPSDLSDDLWKSLVRFSSQPDMKQLGAQARERVMAWAAKAPTEWCPVREARPEVTVRRDSGSPTEWFAGKTVAIWGCGAIGSVLAEWLVRAGVTRLMLRDKANVAPGVLVRQNYVDADLGYSKARRLADRLCAIDPAVQVEPAHEDVLDIILGEGPWHESADLVIDATASVAVSTALEQAKLRDPGPPLATAIFGHTAEHGLLVLCPAGDKRGPVHGIRAAKLACLSDRRLRRFASEFWPEPARTDIFQPEPGCSDPTFTGSAVETAELAAGLLRGLAVDLRRQTLAATCRLIALDGADGQDSLQHHFELESSCDQRLTGGLQLRISETALQAMRDEVEASTALRGPESETGGLLFGERDDAAGVLWVDRATGAPPDSRHSPDEFLCGIKGVRRTVADMSRRGRGALAMVGTWHTHPVTTASPSARDLRGMADLLEAAGSPVAQALLVIVGRAAVDRPSLGGYIFERSMLALDAMYVSGGQRRLTKTRWPALPLQATPAESVRRTGSISPGRRRPSVRAERDTTSRA